jgi:selenoprotein W-related protein
MAEIHEQNPEFGDVKDAPGMLNEEVRARLQGEKARLRIEDRDFLNAACFQEWRELLEKAPRKSAAAVSVASESKDLPMVPAVAPSVPKLVKVKITYCAECGYEPQTLSLAGALMNRFTEELSSIELIPWEDGAFDVHIGNELVHSMYRDGGFPENDAIIEMVKERLKS